MRKILLLVLALGAFALSAQATTGDVNSDGMVDINDVTQLISRVLGQNMTIDSAAADVNDDGLIDINDVTALINYVLKGTWN